MACTSTRSPMLIFSTKKTMEVSFKYEPLDPPIISPSFPRVPIKRTISANLKLQSILKGMSVKLFDHHLLSVTFYPEEFNDFFLRSLKVLGESNDTKLSLILEFKLKPVLFYDFIDFIYNNPRSIIQEFTLRIQHPEVVIEPNEITVKCEYPPELME